MGKSAVQWLPQQLVVAQQSGSFFPRSDKLFTISFSLTRTPTTDVLLNSKITQIHTHMRASAHVLIARTHLFNSLKKNTLKTRTRYGTIASHKSNAFSKLVKTTSDFPSHPRVATYRKIHNI